MANLLNSVVIFFYKIYAARKYRAFISALDNPYHAQQRLKEQLEKDYYRSLRYQKSNIPFDELPIQNYNELAKNPIEDLVTKKILFFEETSGSSGIKKRIPYTKNLLGSFSNMFVIWSYDILKNVNFSSYKFYFSISPQFSENTSGLEDDSAYLGENIGFFSKNYFLKLPNAKSIQDPNEFLLKLGLLLTSNRNLEIISIWSPTFLLSLMTYLKGNEDNFLRILKVGEYKGLKFDPIALTEVNSLNLFPNLKFISTWGSASAQMSYIKLKTLFPNVVIQKKGLLATEAPMTIPLFNIEGSVPLINDVYFEFISKDSEILGLEKLIFGETYEVVISQKGGLLRYPMNDLVRVEGFYKKTPLLEFVGRKHQISDMVGEKLHESEVAKAIEDTGAYALIPSLDKLKYILLVDNSFNEKKVAEIENRLHHNIHYKNARLLGQLNEIEVVSCNQPIEILNQYYTNILNIKKGDIKESFLLYREAPRLLELLKLI